jgi:amino acid transporter
MLAALRRFVFGTPLATSQIALRRLAIPLAFVIVSADPLSSVAYGPEEIVRVFNDHGLGPEVLGYVVFIALAIAVLMLIVVSSYIQVVRAYPGEGGGYIVARENLGTSFGLISAAALLVDYIITVAISTSAGTAAIVSAFPGLVHIRIEISLLIIIALTILNLRGFRESAQFLAFPVYLFVISLLGVIGVGLVRYFSQGATAVDSVPAVASETTRVGPYLLLLAFSSGCVGLTGIEAISNTVGIFRAPESRNARITLLTMGLLLATLFFGVALLAFLFKIGVLDSHETLVSRVARTSFGVNILYYLVQFSTAFILGIAANSAFSSFPRLASVLARDGYLPRTLANLGDRLVLSNGILVLSAFSMILVLLFQANTHHLVPLYAVGVFIGFTLTQSGMVVHWWKDRGKGWVHGLLFNGFGAAVTAVVLVVVTVTKFSAGSHGLGAWITIMAIILLRLAFATIQSHYRAVAEALSLDRLEHPVNHPLAVRNIVIFPIGAVHRAILPALEYARAIGTSVEAVHVAVDEVTAETAQVSWEKLDTGIPLTIIPSPYRAVVHPLVDYIKEVASAFPSDHVTVVIPEFVPRYLWQQLLHNQTAQFLKLALLFQRRVVVTSVPYHLPK